MKRKKIDDQNQLELALFSEPDAAHTEVPHHSEVPATNETLTTMHTDDMQNEHPSEEQTSAQDEKTQEPRLWRDAGWTARVIKNDDDEGWAVAMTKDGEAEPALVGPWTMGRDKKNPKPMDAAAFSTLVKTASEVRRRHEQQLHAMLHKSVSVDAGSGTLNVTLDIVPDEDSAYAVLAAVDEDGNQVAQVRVAPNFKLSKASAATWIANDFRRPD